MCMWEGESSIHAVSRKPSLMPGAHLLQLPTHLCGYKVDMCVCICVCACKHVCMCIFKHECVCCSSSHPPY